MRIDIDGQDFVSLMESVRKAADDAHDVAVRNLADARSKVEAMEITSFSSAAAALYPFQNDVGTARRAQTLASQALLGTRAGNVIMEENDWTVIHGLNELCTRFDLPEIALPSDGGASFELS